MQYLLILALFIAILSVVFALQNAIPIPVNLLIWEVRGSLALVLLVTLGVGILVGILAMAPSLVRKSLKVSHQNKRIKQLQETIIEKEAVATPQSSEASPLPSDSTAIADQSTMNNEP